MKHNRRNSHTWGDMARDEQRLHHNIQQVLITENNGLVFANVRTNETEIPELLPDARRAEQRLGELVEDGFRIYDPQHLLDLWGVLTDSAQSIAALDADSAGYPSYPTGRDADTFGSIEADYFGQIEPEV